jgi:hypothetical protein
MSTWKIGPDLGPLFDAIERIATSLEKIAKASEVLTADKQSGGSPGGCRCDDCVETRRERWEATSG